MKEAINANYMDYKRYKDDLSLKEKIILILKNFKYSNEINDKSDFNEESYIKIVKNLSHMSQIYVNDINIQNYLKEISSVVKIVNTFLAENGAINFSAKESHYSSFNIEEFENDNGIMEYYFKVSEHDIDKHINFNSLSILNRYEIKSKIKYK